MHDHRTSDRRSPDGSEQKNEISQILHTQKILQIFLEVSKEKIEILQILHTLLLAAEKENIKENNEKDGPKRGRDDPCGTKNETALG